LGNNGLQRALFTNIHNRRYLIQRGNRRTLLSKHRNYDAQQGISGYSDKKHAYTKTAAVSVGNSFALRNCG